MRILLIGSVDSQWIRNVVEQFTDENIVFDMFDYSEKGIDFGKLGYSHSHTIVKPSIYVKLFKALHMTSLQRYFLQKQLEKLSKDYDVINLHYVTPWLVNALGKVDSHKIVLSYWGSDLMRKEPQKLLAVRDIVDRVGYITFDSGDLRSKFIEIYGEIKADHSVTMIPLPILDLIASEMNETRTVNPDKVRVAIGYNGREQQQHIEVLDSLRDLPENVKCRLTILLQMTYGGSEEYRSQVISHAEDLGIDYEVYDKYLEDETIARLRCHTDIYINSQETDAFSGSVCENLFAGATLINARWLRYQEFEENAFDYYEFEKHAEIPGIICEILKDNKKADREKNKSLVWKLRSMESCNEQWLKLFLSI